MKQEEKLHGRRERVVECTDWSNILGKNLSHIEVLVWIVLE